MVMYYSMQYEIEDLQEENSVLKQELSNTQTDLNDYKEAFEEVLGVLKETNCILIRLHKNNEVPDSVHAELQEALTDHQYQEDQ